MGYRGLLLNAPYKIDSMVWMRLIRITFLVSYDSLFTCNAWLYEPRIK
jgi:hypothetical protein